MRSHYITSLLVFIPILFFAESACGCRTDAPLVSDKDLKHPPANMIAFKASIAKITSNGDLDQGKPHGGFQLKLRITKIYQGVNLGNTIVVNYGGCHNLPGKIGNSINVLALSNKEKGWYAPQFWQRSNGIQVGYGSNIILVDR
jgi:hypothetical protein